MRPMNFETVKSNLRKDPYLRPGDVLAINDHKTGIMKTAKVCEDKFQTKQGTVKDYYLLLKDMNHRQHIIDIDSTLNKGYDHTEMTLSQIAYQINRRNPRFAVTKHNNSIKEKRGRNKYPDWPFKRVDEFTARANKKRLPFEVVRGEIKDPALAREVGSRYAYYLKANESFSVTAGQEKSHTITDGIQVEKGAISGPIVPSANDHRRAAQIQAIKKLANSPKDQSFWLDDKSRLMGNWYLPQNSIMMNSYSKIGSPDSQVHVGDGLTMIDSWMNDSTIESDPSRAVILNNTGVNRTSLNSHSKEHPIKELFKDNGPKHEPIWQSLNSTISHVTATNHDQLGFDNSYVENADIKNSFGVKDSSLTNNDYNDYPDEFDNVRVSNCDTETDRHNRIHLKDKAVKDRHIQLGEHDPLMNPPQNGHDGRNNGRDSDGPDLDF